MGAVKGRWLIPDENYPEFLDLLNDYLFDKKRRPINLVEQPRMNAAKPLLIDLDFKFPIDFSLTHRFNRKHIRKFVNKIAEGLSTFFDTNVYEQIRFFVSLRPQAYADGKKWIKDGIHIHSPDICLINDKQKVLRNWLLEQEAIQKSFDGIGYINEVDDIYDESMVRKQGWFLYGESKPNIPPYSLDTVMAFNPEAAAIDELDVGQFSSRELLQLLSVRYNVAEDDNEVLEGGRAEYDRFLKPRAAIPSPDHKPAAAPTEVPPMKPIGVYIPEEYDAEEIELARQITLQCLKKERADSYKTWMETGWALYNIDHSEEMFQTWVEFSKKSEKAAGTDWAKMERDWKRGFSRNTAGAKLTLKSLHYWARDDNIEKYTELTEEDLVRFVQYRVEDTHFHIARLLQRMYKGLFCASVESRRTEWYVFDPRIHSWRHTNQGMELQGKLSMEVADLVVRARMRLKKKGWEDNCNKNAGGAGAEGREGAPCAGGPQAAWGEIFKFCRAIKS
jgi:hypothetical protein